MEEHELLDRAHKVDIYALQFVFVPRIQNSLNEFKEGWNYHQLSTEQNKSPYQIWMLGMMDSNRGVQMYLESSFNSNEFFGFTLPRLSELCRQTVLWRFMMSHLIQIQMQFKKS